MWAMYGQMPQHSVAQGNPGLSAADTRVRNLFTLFTWKSVNDFNKQKVALSLGKPNPRLNETAPSA